MEVGTWKPYVGVAKFLTFYKVGKKHERLSKILLFVCSEHETLNELAIS